MIHQIYNASHCKRLLSTIVLTLSLIFSINVYSSNRSAKSVKEIKGYIVYFDFVIKPTVLQQGISLLTRWQKQLVTLLQDISPWSCHISNKGKIVTTEARTRHISNWNICSGLIGKKVFRELLERWKWRSAFSVQWRESRQSSRVCYLWCECSSQTPCRDEQWAVGVKGLISNLLNRCEITLSCLTSGLRYFAEDPISSSVQISFTNRSFINFNSYAYQFLEAWTQGQKSLLKEVHFFNRCTLKYC